MNEIAPYIPSILTFLGTALLTGVGWILRTLSGQNRAMSSQTQALAVLVTRVDPAIANVSQTQALAVTVGQLDTRLTAVENEQKFIRGQMAGTAA